MFFVVEKAKFQWNMSIVRDDRTKNRQGLAGPFMRLEAKDDYLKLDGLEVSAKFPATVYEPGVLFLKVTAFRRLLKSITGEPFLSIQVTADCLLMDKIRLPLGANDMLLYSNPGEAPQQHPSISTSKPNPTMPSPKPTPKCDPEQTQKTLWNQSDHESNPSNAKDSPDRRKPGD